MIDRALTMMLWALVGAPACFFVQPINSEPQARIDAETLGPHYRGSTIVLSADKSSDPDGEPLVADWKAFTCNPERTACDTPSFDSMSAESLGERFAITVPRTRTGRAEATRLVLVTMTVRDPGGAEHEDLLYFDISNRDPAVAVQVQGFRAGSGSGYPIGTSMRIFAQGADADRDPVTYEWQLYPAGGSSAADVRWDELSETVYELEPDVTGLWMVEVTVRDDSGGEDSETASILVQPDAPPCIATTDPPAVPGARYILDQPRRFAVLRVSDDLDVYPPPAPEDAPMGSARFRWQVASPDTRGERVEVTGHTLADFVVDPRAHAPGDRISLRVEIDDRQGRAIVCDDDLPTCSLGGDQCLQRVTWDIEVR